MDINAMHSRAGGKWTDRESASAYERALAAAGVLIGSESPLAIHVHKHPPQHKDANGNLYTLVAVTPTLVITSTFSAVMDEPSAHARPWRALTGLEVTVLMPRQDPMVVDSADPLFGDSAVTVSSPTRVVPAAVLTKARSVLASQP